MNNTRFNGKCKCGAKFSILAHVTRESCEMPRNLPPDVAGCAGVYFSPFPGVIEDTEGFKYIQHEGGIAWRCACLRSLVLKPVRGIIRMDHKCDARCVNATGHDCECACGGKNHGAGHSINGVL